MLSCVLLLQFCGVGKQISEEFFYSMELDGDGITRGSCIMYHVSRMQMRILVLLLPVNPANLDLYLH